MAERHYRILSIEYNDLNKTNQNQFYKVIQLTFEALITTTIDDTLKYHSEKKKCLHFM